MERSYLPQRITALGRFKLRKATNNLISQFGSTVTKNIGWEENSPPERMAHEAAMLPSCTQSLSVQAAFSHPESLHHEHLEESSQFTPGIGLRCSKEM
jgi:hypothetical protein